MPLASTVIGIDLAPIKAIKGCVSIQADITTGRCRSFLKKELQGQDADVFLHDGAPNVGSSWTSDAFAQNELVLHAMKLACEFLRPGGTFVTKVFRSADYNSLLYVFGQLFKRVEATKPQASRNVSAEIFVMCFGFKAPQQLDPQFFDPKAVFADVDDMADGDGEGGKKGRKSGSSGLTDLVKKRDKKNRSGYDAKEIHKVVPAEEFINNTENPAEFLVKATKLSFEEGASKELLDNPLTTLEIKTLAQDLQILGKGDLSLLLKWRFKVRRAREQAAAAARKAQKDNGESDKKGEGEEDEDEEEESDEDMGSEEDGEGGEGDGEDEDDEDDEEEMKEMDEIMRSRMAEQKAALKKRAELQKKRDLRKKLSMGGFPKGDFEPDLFHLSDRAQTALEEDRMKMADADELMDDDMKFNSRGEDEEEEEESGSEDEDGEEEDEDSDADSELDRITQLEIDAAVQYELEKERERLSGEQKKKEKGKKETRRQKVMKEWADEVQQFNAYLDSETQKRLSEQARQEAEESDDDEDDEEEDEEREAEEDESMGEEEGEKKGAKGAVGSRTEKSLQAAASAAASGGDPRAVAQLKRRADQFFSNPLFASAGAGADEEGDIEIEEKREDAKSKRKRDVEDVDGESESEGEGETGAGSGGWFYGPKGAKSEESSDDEQAGDMDDGIKELSDDELPQIPLSDKQKRQLRRKRLAEKEVAKAQRERERRRKLGLPEEEDEEEVGAGKKKGKAPPAPPFEEVPEQAPKPLPTAPLEAPTDPDELAEIQAIGSLMINKGTRMDLIDGAFNRYSFNDPELPDWFLEDEEQHNKPQLPVTKELFREYRQKIKEINQRPIRKVAEAEARKKKRARQRIEKAIQQSHAIARSEDLNEGSKAKAIQKLMKKARKGEERPKMYLAGMKAGGGKQVSKQGTKSRNVEVKPVDKRLKADKRGQQASMRKNKGKGKGLRGRKGKR
uniref:rRNA methyltransferase n=1 Tax=Chromera velia CCMP2878 TaxID=1169474 RepID=A0A0G4H0B1_9ALVE|eukprot:Cvel_24184.t1-p1 / transcript=Cvel_24184.t1 / gene=Cvel_24184 / organism=Chromera_velia_CCMP2878 / gene_product=AdoMet-dependent rRNA methyltransferase spb1, putative / transcript_product=AdoMet-dependent rRNA methyltransferase spb1, putative / location=Cvel_scaffold2582:4700-11439(-) / protein_length=960 / sequence_SO=supercontig / SO=protein_coding / is_pseudo=false